LSKILPAEFFFQQRAADIQPRYPTEITAFNNAQREELYSFIDENENEERGSRRFEQGCKRFRIPGKGGNECHGQNEKEDINGRANQPSIELQH
jgi:hypothetical protein